MKKTNLIIVLLTIFLLIAFFILFALAYPRIMWWMLKPAQDVIAITDYRDHLAHQIVSSLFISLSAIFVGLGTYIISKKRDLKETIIGWFVLIDVAIVAMLGWLAFLKYRFIERLDNIDYSSPLGNLAIEVFFKPTDIHLYEMGIAAAIMVLLVAWIYPKKRID